MIEKVWHGIQSLLIFLFCFVFSSLAALRCRNSPGVILLSTEDHIHVSNGSGEFIYCKIP